MHRPPRRAPPLKRRDGSPPPGSPAPIPPSKMQQQLVLDRPGPASVFTPHASRCGRLGRPNEHPIQGLAGLCGPLRPLENVGPSVYRCGMRHSSSSRALPLPPGPDHHAGGMRRPDLAARPPCAISATDTRPACAGERPGGLSGEDRCGPGSRDFRRGARRCPPSTRSAGASISAGNGLQTGATDTPDTASALRFQPPAGTVRHRDRPQGSAATARSGRRGGA